MKKTYTLLVAALVIAVSLAAGCKGAQKNNINPLTTAAETVKAYCELDAAGKRLSSETWKQVLPYISWSEEPGWDSVVVITGYQVVAITEHSATHATITVDYQVLGTSSRDFVSMKKTESITFSVRKTGKGWKIKSPDFMLPHVLPKPLIAHLESVKNDELALKVKKAVKE